MKRPEIVLCTLGTRGDVEPFFALSASLSRRGYGVTLLSNRNWEKEAIEAGAEFYSIAEEDDPQSGRDDYKFYLKNTRASFQKSFDLVSNWALARRPMMFVHRMNMLGMQAAAERFAIPNGRVVLQPSAIKSCLRPPWPMSVLATGRMGAIGRNVIVPALYGFAELTSPYRRHTNSFRRSVGLQAQQLFHRTPNTEDFTLVLCPKWFAMPQADWPQNSYVVGFPFSDRKEPDPLLEKFIERRGAPVVFTPGTGVTNTAAFFERAASALETLGLPGVFLSRVVPKCHKGNPRIICRDYVDLAWLLPRVRGIFHHGGIGSTAQALRAGIPQIVIPDRFDQPDNAIRVASLGLGAAVLSDRYSGTDWANLFISTSTSHHIKTQLGTATRLLTQENGVSNSVAVIEHFVAQRFGVGSNFMTSSATASNLEQIDLTR